MISQKRPRIYLVLHNIRSTYNVGAIFRTADATGVSKIYISGITPSPIDRFGRERKDISKSSLGAERTVGWESVSDLVELIRKSKEQGVKVVALEQDKKSTDYKNFKKDKDLLIIIGNEVEGVDREILDICDEIVEMPMYGEKESLNVSVACGVMLYSLC